MAKLTSKPIINHIKPTQTAPPLALLAADSFFEISNRFFSQCIDKKKSANLASTNPGLLISSATNLILSIELYLKGILLNLGIFVPRTHNLLELFNLLPKEVIEDLRTKYNSLKPQDGSTKVVELELFCSINPTRDEKESEPKPKSKSIEAVLERASDAFLVWQSAFEIINNSTSSISLEFGYLKAIALALKSSFKVTLNNK